MQIKHLLIEKENESNQERETYLIRNTVNNRYVRLGKNETYYLVEILDGDESISNLNLTGAEVLSEELKAKIMMKFREWGFLDERAQTEKQSPLQNFKRIHIVKFNVEKILKVVYPIYSKLFSKVGLVTWTLALIGVVGYFIYAIATYDASANVKMPVLSLNPLNIFLIVIVIFISTILHEFAHAVTCIKYGGKVKDIGIMLFYCIPCCYCDVTGIYSIKDKKKRAIVGAAGILTSLFIGNVMLITAIILSKFNIVSILLYYLSVGIIFISIYNLIPFVKLDGYWILSALSGVSNLMDKSIVLAYTTIFSRKNIKNIHMKSIKRRTLTVYGIISLFFNEIFWIYTFLSIISILHLKGRLTLYVFIIAVFVIIADFVKTIKNYYMMIKNDYNRILIMM